jgi:hypothetical protein
LDEILRDINIQVLEIKYVLNLGQLWKIVPNIKRYIFKLMKSIQLVQPKLIQPEPTFVVVAIDH